MHVTRSRARFARKSSLFAAIALPGAALAAAPPQVLKAPDAVALDFFGSALAVSGDRLVTSFAARHPALKGRVFSVSIAGDEPLIESTFDTNVHDDGFGTSVAMDGDLVVVGAPLRRSSDGGDDLLRGRIHLLKRAGDGSLSEVFSVPGAVKTSMLGAAVAIDGDVVMAGAPTGSSSGSVHFFQIDGAALFPAGKVDSSLGFGQSVALSEEWAAAGGHPFRNSLGGAVSVMHRDANGAWSIVQTIASPLTHAGDRFGLTLALEGDLLGAGAPAPGQLPDLNRGSLSLYRRSGTAWALEAVLEAPDDRFCEGFGRSVALGPDLVAVGAVSTSDPADDAAAVFLFRRVDTREGSKWIAESARTGLSSEDFGAALAFANERLVIAAPGAAGGSGAAEGEIRVVPIPFADFDGNGFVDGTDLAALLGAWGDAPPGEAADLDGNGEVDGADITILLGQWRPS